MTLGGLPRPRSAVIWSEAKSSQRRAAALTDDAGACPTEAGRFFGANDPVRERRPAITMNAIPEQLDTRHQSQ